MRDQKGIALLAVIFFLLVIAFIGVIFISLSSNSMTEGANEGTSSQAFFVAEGGLERARGYLLSLDSPGCVTCTCASINGNPLFTNVSLGAGEFTVTAVAAGNQCTLTSTGGVPKIASGTSQRVLSQTTGITQQFGWAVGQDNGAGQPTMMRWNGANWTNIDTTLPINIINGNNLTSVSVISSSGSWAVSDGGEIIQWNGTSWGLPVFNAGQSLNSIYMNSSTDGWAVGRGGTIVRFSSGVWGFIASPTGNTLRSVTCRTVSDCWAVGNGGRIVRWQGSGWTVVASSTGSTLRSVTCTATDCWAVGNGGMIVRAQNPTWTWATMASPVPGNRLRSINCVSATDCWAVGDDPGTGFPVMIRWNNPPGIWNNLSGAYPGTNIGANLMSVSMPAPNDGWSVSDGGDVLHWDGASWTVNAQGTAASNGNVLNSVMVIGSAAPGTGWREVPQ